jgi:AAA domain-containing protein
MEWLVKDWFAAGYAHLIGGAPAAGKTGLEIGLMAAALRGESWFGKQTEKPTRWIQFVTDRDLSSRLYWAKVHGVALPGPDSTYCYRQHREDRIKLGGTATDRAERMLDVLRRRLVELAPAPGTVVTIDVASPFFAPGSADYCLGFGLGHALMDVLEMFPGVTFLLLVHGGKYNHHNSPGRLVDRNIGGTSMFGLVHSLSYLATRTEAKDLGHPGCQLFEIVPRTGADAQIVLYRDVDGRLLEGPLPTASPKASPRAGIGGRSYKLSLEQFVAAISEPISYPLLSERLCTEHEASPTTIQRRFKEAKDAGLILEAEQGKWVRA